VPEDLITSVANSFVGLPYRLENVKEIGGIRFINDSFATNPGPTMAAIDSFKEDKILILGGSSKNADFTELAEKITKSNVKAVVLMGQERFRIEKALALSGYQGQIFMEQGDLIKVVQRAKTLAKQGDIVIFSPACASFDMFKNYKDRGAKFREAVQGLEL
jgi:UDP-N-acetylmuramoylalanine--D-glutamate ligase